MLLRRADADAKDIMDRRGFFRVLLIGGAATAVGLKAARSAETVCEIEYDFRNDPHHHPHDDHPFNWDGHDDHSAMHYWKGTA